MLASRAHPPGEVNQAGRWTEKPKEEGTLLILCSVITQPLGIQARKPREPRDGAPRHSDKYWELSLKTQVPYTPQLTHYGLEPTPLAVQRERPLREIFKELGIRL